MSDTHVDHNQVVGIIDAEFTAIERFVDGLTEAQMTGLVDERGWNIRDHLSHLAGWEEGLLMVYFDQPVEVTLGIPLEQFRDDNMDAINEVIREKRSADSPAQVLEKLRSFHTQVMARIYPLTTEDLEQPALSYLPKAPGGYREANVYRLIKEYTFQHYPEHLEDMKKIISSGGS